MEVSFTFDINDPAAKALWDKMWQLASDPSASEPAPAPEPETPPAPEEEKQPTPAQQRAAHARASRAAKQQEKAKPDLLAAAEDLSGPPEPNGADTDDDFGMSPPSMSPGEAHEAALALVREIHAAGKIAEVKKLQKDWSITKFYDIPLESAHDFYRSVMQVAHETGLRK